MNASPNLVLVHGAWVAGSSWYLVATNDEAIPPDAERQFASRMGATAVEVASGHVAMISHPDEVADPLGSAVGAVPVVG
jgi:poly(3-hydroxyalkanoate) synthetase